LVYNYLTGRGRRGGDAANRKQEHAMQTETSSTETETTINAGRATCLCGTRHRDGLFCLAAVNKARVLNETEDVLQALRALPRGTTVLLDTRGARARARTLEEGDALARRLRRLRVRGLG
jgi:hypothetical protein